MFRHNCNKEVIDALNIIDYDSATRIIGKFYSIDMLPVKTKHVLEQLTIMTAQELLDKIIGNKNNFGFYIRNFLDDFYSLSQANRQKALVSSLTYDENCRRELSFVAAAMKNYATSMIWCAHNGFSISGCTSMIRFFPSFWSEPTRKREAN